MKNVSNNVGLIEKRGKQHTWRGQKRNTRPVLVRSGTVNVFIVSFKKDLCTIVGLRGGSIYRMVLRREAPYFRTFPDNLAHPWNT